MKKLSALLLCALLLAAAPMAMAAQITAQGTAEIAAAPDMFTIISNVSCMEITVARAQESVATIIASATEKLLALGVNEEDIVTQDFSYYPERDYSGDTPKMIGYRVNHSLNVTCRDVAMLDSVMAALSDSGFDETWSVTFDISTRSELYRQALELAIGAAEVKAQAMAAAGGLTIKGVSSIEETSYGGSMRYANTAEDAVMMKTAASGSGIRSGDVSVSASVTAVYEAE